MDTEVSKTVFKSEKGYEEVEKLGNTSKNATTVFPLVGPHTVRAFLHCIVWLDNMARTVSPLIPIRPAPASQHNSTAVP